MKSFLLGFEETADSRVSSLGEVDQTNGQIIDLFQGMIVNILDIRFLNESQSFGNGGDLGLNIIGIILCVSGQKSVQVVDQERFWVWSTKDLGELAVLSVDQVKVDAVGLQFTEKEVEVTTGSEFLDERKACEFFKLKQL